MLSERLFETTRSAYDSPQDPKYWMLRAENLSNLGFADLAAGDAYKALQLLNTRLRWFFGDSGSNYEDLSGILLERKAAATQATLAQKTSYVLLASILRETWNVTAAYAMIQEARVRYPSNPHLDTMEKSLAIELKEMEKERLLIRDTFDSKIFHLDNNFGAVYQVAYPFIPKVFLSRSDELIQSTKKEIEIEAKAVFSGCSLRSSAVQDPTDSTNTGAPTALGIFATRDIPEGFPFLIDTTVLAATDNRARTGKALEICDNCCGDIPSDSTQRCSTDCCTVVYCSEKCKDLAWRYYHLVLCKKDFNWIWDDSKTSHPRYHLDGPMWLRILAVCVQSGAHPLEHPLIARLTPLYDEHFHRRWSLSNNIIMPIKILQQLGIDTYADSRFDTWVLQTLWNRNVTNAQLVGNPEVNEALFLMTRQCSGKEAAGMSLELFMFFYFQGLLSRSN